MTYRIKIEVVDEPNVLRRVTLLNTAMLRILTGTRLIRLLSADYEAGCVELLIEGARVRPNPAPGQVRVEFIAIGGQQQ